MLNSIRYAARHGLSPDERAAATSGFIGLGAMGLPMARNLRRTPGAGARRRGATPAKAAALVAAGAVWHESPRSLAADVRRHRAHAARPARGRGGARRPRRHPGRVPARPGAGHLLDLVAGRGARAAPAAGGARPPEPCGWSTPRCRAATDGADAGTLSIMVGGATPTWLGRSRAAGVRHAGAPRPAGRRAGGEGVQPDDRRVDDPGPRGGRRARRPQRAGPARAVRSARRGVCGQPHPQHPRASASSPRTTARPVPPSTWSRTSHFATDVAAATDSHPVLLPAVTAAFDELVDTRSRRVRHRRDPPVHRPAPRRRRPRAVSRATATTWAVACAPRPATPRPARCAARSSGRRVVPSIHRR